MTGDGGLARMFHVKQGWGASYPETTGYAIPTFFSYAEYRDDNEFAVRANRMAQWESRIQMESGAVQGGVVTDTPSPAIFNTGQVLFGWRAAYLRTKDDTYLQSACRAADFLVASMDVDGAWRKNLSRFTNASIETYAYNVRSAWALLLANELGGGGAYKAAALRNVEFVMSLCHENGWIEKNCLSRVEQPLLHTIAYAYQGLLECAVKEGLDDVLRIVERGNACLRDTFLHHGRLFGRYEQNWLPTVTWRCLTGEAQTAIVWHRLADLGGDRQWREAATSLVAQIKRTQALDGDPNRLGGIKGSQPITAPYGRLEYLNWAAKFFADALLLDIGVTAAVEG
jgi:hypothetical protein